MSYRKLFLLPLACAAALSSAAAQELAAVVQKDTELLIDSGGKEHPALMLERGRGLTIVPELSSDAELYVSSQNPDGVELAGWIDRLAVSYTDGNPVPGSADDSNEPPSPSSIGPEGKPSAKLQKHEKRSRKRKHQRLASAEPRMEKKSKKHARHATKLARAEAPMAPQPTTEQASQAAVTPNEKPAAASRQKNVHELLLGLVADVNTREYASTVVRDKSLTKEEKVEALKIFNKYLQDKRADLARSGSTDPDERDSLQKQSEDLLENLSSLDGKDKSSKRDDSKAGKSGVRKSAKATRHKRKNGHKSAGAQLARKA